MRKLCQQSSTTLTCMTLHDHPEMYEQNGMRFNFQKIHAFNFFFNLVLFLAYDINNITLYFLNSDLGLVLEWSRPSPYKQYTCIYLPLERKGGLRLNKSKSHLTQDVLWKVWLKLAQWFWRRRWKCAKITDRRTNFKKNRKKEFKNLK